MDITATLFGQMLTFAVLVWTVKRFLWGPMTDMMEQRKQLIADGLAAAERGHQDKKAAETEVEAMLNESKSQASLILNQAQKRSSEIIEEAKTQAKLEADRIKTAAHAEIEHETNRAKEQLRSQVADLIMSGAEQILKKEIKAAAHKTIVDKFVAQL